MVVVVVVVVVVGFVVIGVVLVLEERLSKLSVDCDKMSERALKIDTVTEGE